MVKTLTKHGNSLALVIDKPILELLNIGAETPLEITTDGHSLVIEPVLDDKHKKNLRKSMDKVNRKYGKALRNLAK